MKILNCDPSIYVFICLIKVYLIFSIISPKIIIKITFFFQFFFLDFLISIFFYNSTQEKCKYSRQYIMSILSYSNGELTLNIVGEFCIFLRSIDSKSPRKSHFFSWVFFIGLRSFCPIQILSSNIFPRLFRNIPSVPVMMNITYKFMFQDIFIPFGLVH